jgi:uncharacterized protein YdaT
MLLILKKFLDKTLIFLKKYWQYIAIFFAGIASVLWFRKNPLPIDNTKAVRDDHNKQLDEIEDVKKDERNKTDVAAQKLEKDLAHIQTQYDSHKKELGEKKKAEIKSILEDHQDDPVALANKLSEVTGFKVIMPKE